MPTISSQLTLALSGESEIVNLARTSGSDCDIDIGWEQDQPDFPLGCDVFHRQTLFTVPSNICPSQFLRRRPANVYPVSNDGFAIAEDSFDDTAETLDFEDDSEETWYWEMDVSLSSFPVSGSQSISHAYLEFAQPTPGDLSVGMEVSVEDTLPGTAPVASGDSARSRTATCGWLQIDVTSVIREAISVVGAESTLTALVLLVRIKPTGASSDTISVASSRHSTLPAPRLVIVPRV